MYLICLCKRHAAHCNMLVAKHREYLNKMKAAAVGLMI